MLRLQTFFTLFCVLMAFQISAQDSKKPSYVDGEVLVRLEDGKTIEPILQEMKILNGKATRVKVVRNLSQNLNVWQIQFDGDAFHNQEIIASFYDHPDVMVAQNNHYITMRNTVPNDPEYANQWQYDNNGANGGTVGADIDAPEAWDITTGGLTATGDTIVVCVIDDGLDVNHDDFGDNRWYNWAEIPNNGIDDDNNGYIDDYLGWNADNNDDDIEGGFFGGGHGTPVAGIIGAKGNNGIGVAGVNWDVKLMIVVGGGQEADAIAAYDYPLTQRKRYNQTSGAEGAFVVATNASWGIDGQQWTDAPIWCAFYDSLGVAGILNAGATTNQNSDVDVVGDMPTSCPSDYMIAVTNLNRTGNKEVPAGYGLTTVDLGAFGASTWTTDAGNTYGGFGGTSGATPHVAGAIALMYSAPCFRLAAMAKTDPQGTALLVRDALLGSVKPNADLQGITVTGGTLNLKNALDSVLAGGCTISGCHEPFALQYQNLQGTQVDLSWWGAAVATSYMVNYREEGASTWNTITANDTFVTITGLMQCTPYEVEIVSDCDTSMSISSSIFTFTTGDCCIAPQNIAIVSNTETTIDVNWDNNPSALQYYVEYRMLGAMNWTLDSSSTTNLQLTGLDPCTEYEVRLLSNCAVNINNEYSATTVIKTRGCGACEDFAYCAVNGDDASYEWISNVTLESLNNTSASDGGYIDFSGTVATPVLLHDTEYPISLTVDRSIASDVTWRVWIDYDQDGDFTTNELVVDESNFTADTYMDSIMIPTSAVLGITRMRVSVKFQGGADACGAFDYGEVEDYCVEIAGLVNVDAVAETTWSMRAFPNPTQNVLNIDIDYNDNKDAQVQLYNATGQLIREEIINLHVGQTRHELSMEQLPNGVYFLRVINADGQMQSVRVVKQ